MMKRFFTKAFAGALTFLVLQDPVRAYLSFKESNFQFPLAIHNTAFEPQALAARPFLSRLIPDFRQAYARWRTPPIKKERSFANADKAQVRRIYLWITGGLLLIFGTLFGISWWAAGGLNTPREIRTYIVGVVLGITVHWIRHELTPRKRKSATEKPKPKLKLRPEEIPEFNPTAEKSFEEWVRERRPRDAADAEHGKIHYHRAIELSDFHMGDRAFRPEKVLRFLRRNKAPIIYINGDFFGGYELERDFFWDKNYNEILKKLLRETKKGTHIVILPGNHDAFIGDWEGRDLDGVTIVNEAVHVTATGARLGIDHGERYDAAVLASPWLKHLGAWGKDAGRRLNQPLAAVRKILGLPRFSLSAWLEEHVDESPERIAYFVDCMVRQAAQDGLDGIVPGHDHVYDARMMGDDYFYGNAGDAMKNFTALVENADGYFRIVPLDETNETDAARDYGPPVQAHPRRLPPQLWEGFDVAGIQLIATDKDNTLLRERENLDPQTLALLEEFHRLASRASLGVFTGDNKAITDEQLETHFSGSLKKQFYRFADGGGTGYAPDGDLIYDHPMPEDIKQALFLKAQETLREALQGPLGTELGITVDDLTRDNKVAGFSMVPKEKSVMERIRDHHAEGWARLTAAVQQAIVDDPKLSLTGYRAIDSATGIDLLKVDKGNALRFLAEHLAQTRGVSDDFILSRTVAFGDSPNDIPMLNLVAEAGGRAFWVGENPPATLHADVKILQAHGPLGLRQTLRSLNDQLRNRTSHTSFPTPEILAEAA